MKIVAPLEGFLGLNDNEFASTLGKPRVTVVPFGLEKTVTYGGGASRGPEAIINASKKVKPNSASFEVKNYKTEEIIDRFDKLNQVL